MKYLLILVYFLFISCSEPDYTHPLLQQQTDTNTTNLKNYTITTPGASQELIPKIVLSGVGSTTVSIPTTLESGVYLYTLNYKLTRGIESTNDSGYASLKNSSNTVVKYISFPPNSREFKQTYLRNRDNHSLEVFMVNETDTWEFVLVYESELNDELKATLVSHYNNEVEIGSDILYKHQWHLKNTGQDTAIETAIAGNDINVEAVWEEGITGKGIRVAIVDQGVEINHPDLVDNMDIKSSWNFITDAKSHDTTPSDPNNMHGTAVAGIVAASWKNGIGGRGVAPKASIISYNMLEAQGQTTYPNSYNILTASREDNIDIYNNSWGMILEGESGGCGRVSLNPFQFVLHSTDSACIEGDAYCAYETQLQFGTKFGRDKNGSIYVKSAGNSGICYDGTSYNRYMNSNFYADQVERFMIVVGASRATGGNSFYTTPGVNVLLNAPGGAVQLGYLKVNEQMVITTDLTSVSSGMDNSGVDTKLGEYHYDQLGNENHDYTDRMNGTSASGPIVSGVVALMLEVNPALKWRDVKYILATTTTKNPITEPETNIYSFNSAGHSFSPYYGFGRVNAKKAVDEAKRWKSINKTLSTEKKEFAFGAEQSVNSIATIDLNIPNSINKVEYINIEYDVNATVNKDNNYELIKDTRVYVKKTANYKMYFQMSGVEDNLTANFEAQPSRQNIEVILQKNGVDEVLFTEPLIAGEHFKYSLERETPFDTRVLGAGDYVLYVNFPDNGNRITNSGNATLTLISGGDQFIYNLKVDLISPSGTVSTIVDAPNYLASEVNSVFPRTRMGSNEFLDENANGTWQLKVTDVNPEGYTTDFIIGKVKLEVYGR